MKKLGLTLLRCAVAVFRAFWPTIKEIKDEQKKNKVAADSPDHDAWSEWVSERDKELQQKCENNGEKEL